MPTATNQNPDAALLAGRYELLALLGRGGMADVYRARDHVLNRDVAVKMLRETSTEESDRARFVSEARILAGLSHVGLVTILDAGLGDTFDGTSAPRPASNDLARPFVVMELVEGPSLAQVISRGPLPLGQVGSVAIQVAEALAYVHGRGVVHRDVKPGNVLLGPEQRVRLADFGIARLLGDTARHTRTGHTIGTAAYLAPEQVTGREVTTATDIYSLGLVLLEALTGRREFPGTPTESAFARLHRQPTVPADLPPVWRELLTGMTATDPQQRPSGHDIVRRLAGQHTAPISPVAESNADTTTAPLPAAGAEPTAETEQLTSPHPPPRPAATPPAPTQVLTAPAQQPPPHESRPSRVDRVGDAVSGAAQSVLGRVGALTGPHRIALAVAAALVILVVVSLSLSLGSGGGGHTSRPIPDNTPTNLRDPLQRLHDAVDGGQR